MSLSVDQQLALDGIFRRLDRQVAMDVRAGVLEPKSALAVLTTLAEVVGPMVPRFARSLIPQATTDAVKAVNAEVAETQRRKGEA